MPQTPGSIAMKVLEEEEDEAEDPILVETLEHFKRKRKRSRQKERTHSRQLSIDIRDNIASSKTKRDEGPRGSIQSQCRENVFSWRTVQEPDVQRKLHNFFQVKETNPNLHSKKKAVSEFQDNDNDNSFGKTKRGNADDSIVSMVYKQSQKKQETEESLKGEKEEEQNNKIKKLEALVDKMASILEFFKKDSMKVREENQELKHQLEEMTLVNTVNQNVKKNFF